MRNINLTVKKASGFYVFLILLLMGNVVASAAEIADGNVARNKLEREVRTLLHEEKYNELENMAYRFRTEKTRFPDGGWKILCFYRSFYPYYGWNELFNNLNKWLKKYPDSVTARVALGNAWYSYAWEARGSGYANTVTEQNWKIFDERMAKAYEFVKNPPKYPSKDCMHRYTVLLVIARAKGWDRQKYEALFQKAISLEPAYYENYFEKTTYLLPRWHGEKGDWQKFAEEAVKLTPKSEGMAIYTRILVTVWGNKEFTEFREPDISWKKMKQGFRDIDKLYPNSPTILNYFCMFACIAGDKATAIELFKRIGDIPYFDVWRGQANFYKWQKWAGLGQ